MNESPEKFYEVETPALKEKIRRWRLDYVDSVNSLEGSLLDQRVVATFIQGQVNDTQILIQWCEILTHKIEQLEAKLKQHDPSN